MIPLSWIDAAMRRYAEYVELEKAGKPSPECILTMGVDTARIGGDKTVLAIMDGPKVLDVCTGVTQAVIDKIKTFK